MRVVLALLMLASTPAWAEWVKLIEDSESVSYLDLATLRKDGPMRKLWILGDLKQSNPESAERSVLAYVEYDCKDGRVRVLEAKTFSEPMGKGKANRTITTPEEWRRFLPDSDDATIHRIVCAK